MSTLATLVVKLTADTGAFQRDMEKGAGSVGRMVSSVKSNVQSLGKVAIGGMAVVGGAALAGGLALGKLAKDAAELETVEKAFAGIAEASGSSQAEMIRNLEEGSAGMVSQRELMLTYNKAAQLVGTTFANQLPEAMEYLQKVAGATGQDMGFLLESLTVGVGRLSPMILDNLSIQVSLAEATAMASEMFGVEAEELTKAQQQAGMMAVTLEKLKENTAAMPSVADSAAAGVARMGARFQNLKDRIGLAVLPVFNLLMGILGKLMDKFLPPIQRFLEEKLVPIFMKLAGGVESFIGNLANGHDILTAFQALLGRMGFGEVANQLNPLVQRIRELWGSLQEAMAPVIDFILNNVELKDVLIALGIAIASVVIPMVIGLVAAFLPLILTAAALIGLVALIRTAWENDLGGIRTFIQTALGAIAAWWSEHGAQVIATAQTFMATVRERITTAIETVRAIVNTVLSWVQSFWATHGAQIQTIAEKAWAMIQLAVQKAIEFIQSLIETALTAIQNFWDSHGEAIMSLAEGAWTAIQDIVQSALDIIEGIINAVTSALQGDWEGFNTALQDIWDAAWRAVKSIIQNVIPELVSFIGGLVTDIWAKIQEVDWAELGRSIINGIKDGVLSVAGALLSSVKDAVGNALQGAKDLLGIGSPSKVFMEQVGRPIIEGWARGLADTRPIERAIQGAAGGSLSLGMQFAQGAGGGAVNIYGDIHLHDVQSANTLLEELQALTIPGGGV